MVQKIDPINRTAAKEAAGIYNMFYLFKTYTLICWAKGPSPAANHPMPKAQLYGSARPSNCQHQDKHQPACQYIQGRKDMGFQHEGKLRIWLWGQQLGTYPYTLSSYHDKLWHKTVAPTPTFLIIVKQLVIVLGCQAKVDTQIETRTPGRCNHSNLNVGLSLTELFCSEVLLIFSKVRALLRKQGIDFSGISALHIFVLSG